MSLLHKLSHFFGFNSTFRDTYVEDGFVWTGTRCATCLKVDQPLKIGPAATTPDGWKQILNKMLVDNGLEPHVPSANLLITSCPQCGLALTEVGKNKAPIPCCECGRAVHGLTYDGRQLHGNCSQCLAIGMGERLK